MRSSVWECRWSSNHHHQFRAERFHDGGWTDLCGVRRKWNASVPAAVVALTAAGAYAVLIHLAVLAPARNAGHDRLTSSVGQCSPVRSSTPGCSRRRNGHPYRQAGGVASRVLTPLHFITLEQGCALPPVDSRELNAAAPYLFACNSIWRPAPLWSKACRRHVYAR
jgi:hypothetical protein